LIDVLVANFQLTIGVTYLYLLIKSRQPRQLDSLVEQIWWEKHWKQSIVLVFRRLYWIYRLLYLVLFPIFEWGSRSPFPCTEISWPCLHQAFRQSFSNSHHLWSSPRSSRFDPWRPLSIS
jgi:hypothetical protein